MFAKKAQKINGDKVRPKLIYYIDVGLTNNELQLVVGHLVSLQGTNANIDSQKTKIRRNKMIIKYNDRIIAKDKIDVNVNAKVAHFLQKEEQKKVTLTNDEFNALSKKKKDEYSQRKFEKDLLSFDELVENGFQPSGNSIEQELYQREKEQRYLSSPEYRSFRQALKEEIRKVFDIMSEQEKKVMYLRFFLDYSLSQIAKTLNIARGTAQEYVATGCKYIKYFLDNDVKEQNKIDRARRMKIEQEKCARRKK